MVFKDPFMELVEEIRRKAVEYIGMRSPVARSFVNNASAMPIRPVCIIPITF
jgi:hypothetical protein